MFTNLQKLVEELGEEFGLPSYAALQQRIYRARKRTGKGVIRLKGKDGTLLTVEVRDLE